MFAGYALGVVVGEPIVPFFDVIGKVFINLLFMVACPFIFFSITAGVASMSDLRKTGRIGLKIILFYLGTTIISTLVGLGLAWVIGPGRGFTMVTGGTLQAAKKVPTVGDMLLNMVPSNIFRSLTELNLMQIIVFSVFLGVSLVLLGERKKAVLDFFNVMSEALIKMTGIVMKTVPLGVFSLMVTTGAKYGPDALMAVSKVLIADYITFLFQLFVVLGLVLMIFAKVTPFAFVKRSGEVIATAVSTTSSSATLPITIRTGVEKMGIPKEVADFTLPLGATVNLNGAAANIAVCVVFSAQVYNFNFTTPELLSLVFSAVITAVGVAGMPGSAIVFTLAILSNYGIPAEAYAIIIGVYRLVDMGMTPLNILGDLACTVAVCSNEKILDRSKWE